jgi:hypothetical protein
VALHNNLLMLFCVGLCSVTNRVQKPMQHAWGVDLQRLRQQFSPAAGWQRHRAPVECEGVGSVSGRGEGGGFVD